MRRDFAKERFCEPLSRFVSVREEPDPTGGLHQGHDEFNLCLGAFRAHRRHHMRQAVLAEPPDGWKALDDDQVVAGSLDPKAVVEEQRLSELIDGAVALATRGEAITGVALAYRSVVDDAASIAQSTPPSVPLRQRLRCRREHTPE
jgi:hypothetical protein